MYHKLCKNLVLRNTVKRPKRGLPNISWKASELLQPRNHYKQSSYNFLPSGSMILTIPSSFSATLMASSRLERGVSGSQSS